MSRRSILSDQEEVEINLSSMIDCIFILLIFFIVTTVFVEEKGLQASKPDASAAPSHEESESVTLEITADNQIRIDKKVISSAEVTALVRARARDPETPVTIRAHERSHHGTFVATWDAAKKGGAKLLSFTTVQ
jgi:biopolymer transport protein ExbD